MGSSERAAGQGGWMRWWKGLVGAGCLGLLLGFSEPFWWLGAMASNLRSYFALLALAGLISTWRVPSRMMRWVCAGLLVICLTSFFPGSQALPRAGRKMDELRAFRLFTYNVLVSATNYEEVIRTVREQSPDVALFLEVDVSWADALAVLEGEYPYFDVEASGAFGLAVYSRVPLEEVIIEDVSGYGFVSVMADLEWEGTPVRVVGTHPPPPIDAFSWKVQQTHLDELAEIICKERRPVLIGGDFNCAPWTQTALRFGRKGRILRSTRSWRATWSSAFREGFGLPLDHHWGSPEWRVKEHRFGPFQESDHRWIMTDFVLPEGSKEGG